jgi:hypothetical protein
VRWQCVAGNVPGERRGGMVEGRMEARPGARLGQPAIVQSHDIEYVARSIVVTQRREPEHVGESEHMARQEDEGACDRPSHVARVHGLLRSLRRALQRDPAFDDAR